METICNGEFMNKEPEEAWDYFDILAENAQTWDTSDKIKQFKTTPTAKGGMYLIKEETNVNIKIANVTRKTEAIELSQASIGKAANESQETPVPNTYAPPKKSLEDTLQAFIQTQTQINQNTIQALQDLKNSVDRIEARLNAEEKEECSAQPHINNEEV